MHIEIAIGLKIVLSTNLFEIDVFIIFISQERYNAAFITKITCAPI